MMLPFALSLAINLFLCLQLILLGTTYAASDEVICDPKYPGNNTECTCAPGHEGCTLSDCVTSCTCLGSGCAMPDCLTNCYCPEGGCKMDVCISDCVISGGEPDQEENAMPCAPNSPCAEEGLQCTEGTETCCGETFDSLVCNCAKTMNDSLEYMCYFTDACMIPQCENEPEEIIVQPPTSPTDGDAKCESFGPCFEEGSTCKRGTETCCGETYHSFECDCEMNTQTGNLEYVCMYTDACMMPKCETDEPADNVAAITDATESTSAPTKTSSPTMTNDGPDGAKCEPFAACLEEGSSCVEGTETCCGETHDSLVCNCEQSTQTGTLEYVCMYTDACLSSECDTDEPNKNVSEIPQTDEPTDNDVTCKPNSPCSEEGSSCTVGTETCCGETYASMACDCEKNLQTGSLEYLCMYTDACLSPECNNDACHARPARILSSLFIFWSLFA